MRRLSKDEHLGPEFATTWPQYDLDPKTRALLTYAKKLTQEPSMVEDSDIEDLRAAGWGRERDIRGHRPRLVLQLQRSDGSRFRATDGHDTGTSDGTDARRAAFPQGNFQ